MKYNKYHLKKGRKKNENQNDGSKIKDNNRGAKLCLIRPGLYRRQQGLGSEKINQERVNGGKGEEIRTN